MSRTALLQMLKSKSSARTWADDDRSMISTALAKTIFTQSGLHLCSIEMVEELRQLTGHHGWRPVQYAVGFGPGIVLATAMVEHASHEGNVLDLAVVDPDLTVAWSGNPSTAVIIVDVLNQGNAIAEMVTELKDLHFSVEGVIALIDMERGGVKALNGAGAAVASIFKMRELKA